MKMRYLVALFLAIAFISALPCGAQESLLERQRRIQRELQERQEREQASYEEACRAGTIEALRNYLQLYPEGAHVEDANNRIADFTLWQTAINANTEQSYRDYLMETRLYAFLETAIDSVTQMRMRSALNPLRAENSRLRSEQSTLQSQNSRLQTEINNIGTTYPMIINSIEIANTDYNGNIETDYGNVIYSSRTLYLQPRIKYSGITSGNKTLKVKLYMPDGTLSTGTDSPSGFSFTRNCNISSGGPHTLLLIGWGSSNRGHWRAGTYRIEIWYENVCLKAKSFTIH